MCLELSISLAMTGRVSSEKQLLIKLFFLFVFCSGRQQRTPASPAEHFQPPPSSKMSPGQQRMHASPEHVHHLAQSHAPSNYSQHHPAPLHVDTGNPPIHQRQSSGSVAGGSENAGNDDPAINFSDDEGSHVDLPPGVTAVNTRNGTVLRKQREFIPDNRKDESYWDRRRRNNEAAKRSR